jgi:hypothetical protein
MIFNTEDYIDDYLSSQHYTIISGEIKEHAETILQGMAYFLNEQIDTKSRLESLEKVLDRLSDLSLSLKMKEEIPDLLSSYFSFVSQSGRFPEAALWENDILTLKAGFLQKFRENGSVRGKTYKKRYTDVGRNDPCPCGSGIKFKKCCMKLISE